MFRPFLVLCSWLLTVFGSSGTEVQFLLYYLSTSDDVIYNGDLVTDCNLFTSDNNFRICPNPSRLADNVTEEGQQFDSDSNKFIGWRGDFELVFEFPDNHITRVDIYFYNDPRMGYGLPPIKEARYYFDSLTGTPLRIEVSFANNSHLSQSDNSVTVVSIVVSSDLQDTPYAFLHLSFDTSPTLINETFISEVKFFNKTDHLPSFTDIQFSNQNQFVQYGLTNDAIVSSVELSCTVAIEGSFSITWTGPNGTIASSGNKTRIFSADTTRTSILRISQVSLMDNGTYSCEATYSHTSSSASSATDTVTLILGGSVSHPNTVQAQEGDDSATLQCNFTGYFPSTINVIWRGDGNGVEIEDSTDGYNITTSSLNGPGLSQRGGDSVESGVTSTLTITSIVQSDLGTQYTCIMDGTNIQGTIQLIERIAPPSSSSTYYSSSSYYFSSSSSSLVVLGSLFPPVATPSSSFNEVSVIAVCITGGVLLTVSTLVIILIIVICYKKRRKDVSLEDFIGKQSDDVKLDEACYVDIDAEIQKEMEARFSGSVIDRCRLELVEKLGEGEFGVVYRGLLADKCTSPTIVAVKTLKGSANPSKADNIIDEGLKMQSFNHLNVLPLIGVCLDLKEAPCIVVPFMNEGSLLSYLKREKHNLIVSRMAEEKTISETAKKLLSMCLQVANGMAYLAEQKFVHRDLAARNCMISSDGIIKVADFGLSEDIYESEYFRQPKQSKDNVKLPLKWMALESIYYGTFSENTDVWSYGVLCWEVFTSGMLPYSGMSPKEVLSTLNAGQRLEKPSNGACSQEIYSLMLNCWNESDNARHSFAEIVKLLESLIAPLAEYMDFTEQYMTMNVSYNFNRVK